MMEAGAYLPPHVQPWAQWMQFCLFLLPLAFLKFWPPRIVLLSQVINIVVAYIVFIVEGDQVTKLFGLGHLIWAWPLVLLVRDWKQQESRYYRGFILVASATILISLVFDVRDIVQWGLGDRGSVLVGVPAESPLSRP